MFTLPVNLGPIPIARVHNSITRISHAHAGSPSAYPRTADEPSNPKNTSSPGTPSRWLGRCTSRGQYCSTTRLPVITALRARALLEFLYWLSAGLGAAFPVAWRKCGDMRLRPLPGSLASVLPLGTNSGRDTGPYILDEVKGSSPSLAWLWRLKSGHDTGRRLLPTVGGWAERACNPSISS